MARRFSLPAKFDHQSVITEWLVRADNPDEVDPASRRVVLRVDEPQFNHDGGAIAFGPDGFLYISFGDGGAGNDFGPGHSLGGNGQDTSNILATISRIDPLGKSGAKSANGQYSIPADNPLVGKDGLDEIWAWGQRNPYRMSFDSKTGDLVVADVGQEMVEEINLIQRGGNYGWPVMEGPYFFVQQAPKGKNTLKNAPDGVDPSKFIGPVAMYDHDDGISITGGFVYRGKAIPALQGYYVFGEWNAVEVVEEGGKTKRKDLGGRLFYADLKKGEILEFQGAGAMERIAGFGQDSAGELYVLTNNGSSPVEKDGSRASGGKVWKIQSK